MQRQPMPGVDVPTARPEVSPPPQPPEADRYRTPRLIAIGTATALLRRNIDGHLKDGTGGWWVWGS